MAFNCPLPLTLVPPPDPSWLALPPDVNYAFALPTLVVLGWGLLAGVQHALDADHLAAVSTIVSERKHWLSSSLVGGLWGVGHTLALLAAGGLMLLMRVQIGERTALALEFGVGLMLVGLGANVLWKLRRGARRAGVRASAGTNTGTARARTPTRTCTRTTANTRTPRAQTRATRRTTTSSSARAPS
jgi:hypothetical protein